MLTKLRGKQRAYANSPNTGQSTALASRQLSVAIERRLPTLEQVERSMDAARRRWAYARTPSRIKPIELSMLAHQLAYRDLFVPDLDLDRTVGVIAHIFERKSQQVRRRGAGVRG